MLVKTKDIVSEIKRGGEWSSVPKLNFYPDTGVLEVTVQCRENPMS